MTIFYICNDITIFRIYNRNCVKIKAWNTYAVWDIYLSVSEKGNFLARLATWFRPHVKQTTILLQTRIMSAMLGIYLPCSHLYFLKNEFPDITPPPLKIINLTNGALIFEYKIIETPKVTLNLDYFEKIRRLSYKMIKNITTIKKRKLLLISSMIT